MLPDHKIQRIKHLQLQGFTPDEAARMQDVPLNEVLKVYNEDKVFVEDEHRFFSHSNHEHTGSSK
jgi:hypothetical protein